MRTPYMYTCSPSMGINKTKTAYNTHIYSDTIWNLYTCSAALSFRNEGIAAAARPTDGLDCGAGPQAGDPRRPPYGATALKGRGTLTAGIKAQRARHPPPPATWALNQNRPARSCRLLGGICEEGSLPPTVSGVPRTDRRRLAATHRHRRACPRFRSASGFFRSAPSSPRPDGSHSPIRSRCRA